MIDLQHLTPKQKLLLFGGGGVVIVFLFMSLKNAASGATSSSTNVGGTTGAQLLTAQSQANQQLLQGIQQSNQQTIDAVNQIASADAQNAQNSQQAISQLLQSYTPQSIPAAAVTPSTPTVIQVPVPVAIKTPKTTTTNNQVDTNPLGVYQGSGKAAYVTPGDKVFSIIHGNQRVNNVTNAQGQLVKSYDFNLVNRKWVPAS